MINGMKYRHTSIWHYIYWLIPCSMWLTFTSCSIFRAISAFLPRFTFSPVRSNSSLPYEISKNKLENCKWPWSRENYRGFYTVTVTWYHLTGVERSTQLIIINIWNFSLNEELLQILFHLVVSSILLETDCILIRFIFGPYEFYRLDI